MGSGSLMRSIKTLYDIIVFYGSWWWRAGIAAAAALAALLPVPPGLVEDWYSTGAYPAIQRGLTAASNLLPFALLDVAMIGVPAWLVWRSVDDRRVDARTWRVVAGLALLRAGTTAAVAYLLFLAVWGLNYRRVPLDGRVPFDHEAVSQAGARALARRAVSEVNSLYTSAHAKGWGEAHEIDRSLERGFSRAARALGADTVPRVGRPKTTVLDLYFRRAGVAGMTDPWFLETLVASDLLPFERPAVIAHEWSHLAGLNDEGEASFLGWLATLGGGEPASYSGWLFMYGQVAASLGPRDREQAAALLQDGPKRDLAAIADRVRRQVSPAVSEAGWRVYDRYLKANQVEAGTASYAEVVRLALGARVDPVGPVDPGRPVGAEK